MKRQRRKIAGYLPRTFFEPDARYGEMLGLCGCGVLIRDRGSVCLLLALLRSSASEAKCYLLYICICVCVRALCALNYTLLGSGQDGFSTGTTRGKSASLATNTLLILLLLPGYTLPHACATYAVSFEVMMQRLGSGLVTVGRAIVRTLCYPPGLRPRVRQPSHVLIVWRQAGR